MLLDLFKKIKIFIKIMFTEDKLAAAQIAQLFGSELLKVQQNSKTDSDSVPDIVRLDPKQFLFNSTTSTAIKKSNERAIVEALQREAEAAYPIASFVEPPVQQPAHTSLPQQTLVTTLPATSSNATGLLSGNSSPIESIAASLERIASCLESLASSAVKKPKKQKRTAKKTTNVNNFQ
jgi:hypothetical protein